MKFKLKAAGMALSTAALAMAVAQPAQAALLSASDVAVAEGNLGTTPVFFRFSLDSALLDPMGIVGLVSAASATNGVDYIGPGNVFSGTLLAGSTFVDVKVADIVGDLAVEADEHFTIDLLLVATSARDDVTFGRTSWQVTILNDDSAGPVPEPAGGALVGMALAAAALARRRSGRST